MRKKSSNRKKKKRRGGQKGGKAQAVGTKRRERIADGRSKSRKRGGLGVNKSGLQTGSTSSKRKESGKRGAVSGGVKCKKKGQGKEKEIRGWGRKGKGKKGVEERGGRAGKRKTGHNGGRRCGQGGNLTLTSHKSAWIRSRGGNGSRQKQGDAAPEPTRSDTSHTGAKRKKLRQGRGKNSRKKMATGTVGPRGRPSEGKPPHKKRSHGRGGL